jgi:hypothetical protein
MLPSGTAVLFALGREADGAEVWSKARIIVEDVISHTRKTLVQGGNAPYFLAPWHLLYALGGTILAISFNPATQAVEGIPTPVLEGVGAPGVLGDVQFSISKTGTLAYVPGPAGTISARGVAVLDRKGLISRLEIPPAPYRRPRVSRDGRHLAVDTDDGHDAIVWIYELSGTSARRRLTFGGRNRFPVWTADGDRVTFQSDRDGDTAIFSQRADGTGDIERLTTPVRGEMQVPESWSPDGRHLLFTVEKGGAYSLWVWSVGDKKATPFGSVQSVEPLDAVFSPNGRWIAYAFADVLAPTLSSNRGIYVQPFPATGARYQVPTGALDFHPAWAPSGDELLYVPAIGRLSAVRLTGSSTLTFGSPVSLSDAFVQQSIAARPREYDVLPDGRLIGLLSSAGLDPAEKFGQIRVIVNWTEELKAKLAVK